MKQVRMYYELGTAGRCCICAWQTLREHSPGGNTFLCEMTSCRCLNVWPQIENPIPSIDAYLLEENSAKFHHGPVW